MFAKSCLLITVLTALSVAASPLLHLRDDVPAPSLTFSMNLNLTGMKLADLDRARVAHLLNQGKAIDEVITQGGDASLPSDLNRRASSISATNAGVSYVTTVNIGSPATSYELLIDTGSSNTWVSPSVLQSVFK